MTPSSRPGPRCSPSDSPRRRPAAARCRTPAADGAEPMAGYTRGESIGGGPLGSVHRGKHVALGTDVCIKELKDIFGYFSFLQRGEVLKRLKRELCAQAQVRHPAVVTIFDQAVEGARPYVVMELLSGSLRDRLDGAGGKGLPVAPVDPDLPPAVLRAARRARLGADAPQPQAGERPLRRLRQREARRLRPLAGHRGRAGQGAAPGLRRTGSLSYLAPELITAEGRRARRRTSTGWASSSTRC